MILKVVKVGVLSGAGVLLVGGILFGGEMLSYVGSSARSVKTAVKGAVPIEFELRRAKDMLDDIIPEMQANIRLIAQEEVEVDNLKDDIQRCRASLQDEKQRIAKVRDTLDTRQASYTLGGFEYSRDYVTRDLANRFERFKEAEVVLAGKERLLETRHKSLAAAMQMLEQTRAQKVRLEDQIEGLESQYRLVQAAAVGSTLQVDNSSLAKSEKLIREIKKRLDVAERVLAHETRFVQPLNMDIVDEADLMTQVDAYFSQDGSTPAERQPAPLAMGTD